MKKIGSKLEHGKGVVVFLDALGTKTAWTSRDPKKFIDSYEKVLKSFYSSKKLYSNMAEELKDDDYYDFPEIIMRSFSDTIILFLYFPINKRNMQIDRLFELRQIGIIAMILNDPFYEAIKKGIYLRGVISIGEFYLSDKIIIGPAVEEAAEWYEKSDWIGIST
ncbi:MAG: hypothetical protein ACYCV8_09295, partial [bacterium]